MGTKYSTVAISGYNSNPPADDGTQVASNQLQWSKHKTKIGDPLKTATEAINSALVTALNQSARLITSSDSSIAGDHIKTIQIGSTVTSAITFTLADAATMAAGYIVHVSNQSTTIASTIARATGTDTINGQTSNVTIYPLQAVTFIVNAAVNGYLAWSMEPPTLASSLKASGSQWLAFAVGDQSSALTTSVAAFTWMCPQACVVKDVDASVKTASSSGVVQFDINDGGTTILSTKLTLDANEKNTSAAAAAEVISDTALARYAEVTMDIDLPGTGAVGPMIYMLVEWI